MRITYSSLLKNIFSILVLICCHTAFAYKEDGRLKICNESSVDIFYALSATSSQNKKINAMTQGFEIIEIGSCNNIFPHAMTKMDIVFFLENKNGYMSNVVLTIPGSSKGEMEFMCINPTEPYRDFGSIEHIKKHYHNESCPKGFSSITASAKIFLGNVTNTWTADSLQKTSYPAWKDKNGKRYKKFALLDKKFEGKENSLVKKNIILEQDIKQQESLKKSREKQLAIIKNRRIEAMVRRAEANQKKRSQHEKVLAQVKNETSLPSKDECKPYMEKNKFKNIKKITLAGISKNMPTLEANKALICNGFSIDTETVARLGGLEKTLSSPYFNGSIYKKTTNDGAVVTLELQTNRAPNINNNFIVSKSIIYKFKEVKSINEIKKIKDKLLKKYKVRGKKTIKDEKFIIQKISKGEIYAVHFQARRKYKDYDGYHITVY